MVSSGAKVAIGAGVGLAVVGVTVALLLPKGSPQGGCPSADVPLNPDGTCPSGYVPDITATNCCAPNPAPSETIVMILKNGSTSVNVGEVFPIQLSGGVPGNPFAVYADTTSIGTGTFDASGNYSGTLTMNTEGVYVMATEDLSTGAVSNPIRLTVTSTTQGTVAITISTPPGCTISLGGNTYTNGDTAILLAGTYPLTANSCSGYTFGSWTFYGVGALGNGTTNASNSLIIPALPPTTQYDTLTANYTGTAPPPTGYNVTVGADGCSQVPVAINGTATTGVVNLDAGTYTIQATPSCSRNIAGTFVTFTFSGWYTSGGVSVASPDSTSTTMLVTGVGTIVAGYTTGTPPSGGNTYNAGL